jgi:hypothetical protein
LVVGRETLDLILTEAGEDVDGLAQSRLFGREKISENASSLQPANGWGNLRLNTGGSMPSAKQSSAARKNIKKAAAAATQKRTIAHLPKSTRTALGKQAAKVAKQKRQASK